MPKPQVSEEDKHEKKLRSDSTEWRTLVVPNMLEEKDWDLLLRRIKSWKCTPFLGAGACCEKIPIGSQIAEEWAKKYDYPMEDSDDLIRVAQFVAVTEDHKTFPNLP
jgi:hypothetical protein